MKVAVTGASGFIGRHVLAELDNLPIEILAVTRDASRLSNCRVIPEIIEMDLSRDVTGCYQRLSEPDLLIHLSWDGLPNYGSLNHFEKELTHQYRFLKAMITGGLPSLFVAGTCFEYGMQSGQLSESSTPTPNNSYGYAKNALRSQLEFLRVQFPFAMTWGRLFYTYGDGQPQSALFSQLKAAVLRGDAFFNMSEGEQLRDYLPVTDIARNIAQLAILKPDSGIVNICSGYPTSVRRLVERWIDTHNWTIKLNLGYFPYPKHEPLAFWGDRAKLDSLLGDALATNCVRAVAAAPLPPR